MTPEETVAELLEGLDNDARSFDKRAKGFLAALSAAGFVVVPREEAYAKCDVCGAAVDSNADACANCG